MRGFRFLPLVALAGVACPSLADSPGPLAPLPRQQLPGAGCAAFLWTKDAAPILIAMASAAPARLRVSLGGQIIDLERVGGKGGSGDELASHSDYASTGISASLDLQIEQRGDLVNGMIVRGGVLRIDRTGADGVAIPVGGLIGCA